MTVNLDRIVRTLITRATRTVSRRSFGTIMLAGYHDAWPDRVRSFTDPDDMVTDGLPEDHPLVLAARTVASQSPKVTSWKVGRRVGAPTQIIRITPVLTTEGLVYSGTIGGEEWTYTVAAAATVASICTAIAAAINALTGAFTADATAATHVDVEADTAGDWFAFSFDNAVAELLVDDQTAEPATTLATDLAAIKAADANWYGLVVADAQSHAQLAAIAAWAETQTILYAGDSFDSDVESVAATDICSALKAASYFRTFIFYSRGNHGAFPSAALLGAIFPLAIGSADYEFKQLVGITADELGETEVGRLIGTRESPTEGKGATIYVEAIPTGVNSGTAITMGGLVAGGEWIDVITGLDYWRALLQERAFNFRLNKPKVPFTAAGIDAFVGTVRSATNSVAAAPFNILDPDSLTFESTALEDVDPADRQARLYDGVQVNARVQGAIRALDVSATVSP